MKEGDTEPGPTAPANHATTTGMTGGGFYNQNSAPQWKAIEQVLPLLDKATSQLPIDGEKALHLADFGCSEGRNSVAVLSRAISNLRARTGKPIQTVHSDLPTNDFSRLFLLLAGSGGSAFPAENVYSSAVAGSMYDQLLPPLSVHLATTFNAIGFLSRKPVDRLPGYILPNGPSKDRNNGSVSEADRVLFSELAKQDVATFLKARADELVPGGKLLVQVFGANQDGRTCDGIYDLLNDAVLERVAGGDITPETYEHYYQPVYMRTLGELTAPATDPSFGVSHLFRLDEALSYEVPVTFNERFQEDGDLDHYARDYVNFFRAFTETVLTMALPATDGRSYLVRQIYERAEALLKANPERYPFRYMAVAMLLTRTDQG